MKRILLLLAFYFLASFAMQVQIVSGEDSIKVLWNVEIQDICGNEFSGINLSPKFSQDGTYILNTIYLSNSPFGDNYNQIQKRDIETGEVVKEYEAKRPGKFTAFDISKDGKYIAFSKFGTNDSIITILDQNTLEFVKDIKIDRGKILNGFKGGYIQALKISPDSKYIVAAIYIKTYIDVPNEGCTVVYDLESGEYVDEITYSMNFEGSFHDLEYSSDGKYLAGNAI